MNAAVHVMCFYYSSWNDKIYANIKISKVGKTWLSACTPVYSFSVVRTGDTGGGDTRFLQPCPYINAFLFQMVMFLGLQEIMSYTLCILKWGLHT